MSGYGFTDAWTVRNGAADPGYTCCQQDLLMNPVRITSYNVCYTKLLRRVISVPVGDALIGRVVDPLGRPLDGKGPIVTGDTKVMGRGELDGIVLNTTGIALCDRVVPDSGLRPGDRLIVTNLTLNNPWEIIQIGI